MDGIRGLKIGIPREIFDESWDPDIRACIDRSIEILKNLGAEIIDITYLILNMLLLPSLLLCAVKAAVIWQDMTGLNMVNVQGM